MIYLNLNSLKYTERPFYIDLDFSMEQRFCLTVLYEYTIKTTCIVQPIKKPVRTLSIFKSMAFVKHAKGISFKNRLKGHINWRKVRNFNVI